MSTPEDHKALLEALVVGELSLDDPKIQRAMTESEEFRDECEAMTRIQGAFDDEDALRNEILAEIAQAPQEKPSDEFLSALRTAAQPPPPSKPRDAWRGPLLLLVAAALLGLIWAPWDEIASYFSDSTVVEDDGSYLGDTYELINLSPTGDGPVTGEFSWEVPDGEEEPEYFILHFTNLETGVTWSTGKITKTRDTVEDRWPNEFDWRVTAHNANGDIIGQGEAEIRKP